MSDDAKATNIRLLEDMGYRILDVGNGWVKVNADDGMEMWFLWSDSVSALFQLILRDS